MVKGKTGLHCPYCGYWCSYDRPYSQMDNLAFHIELRGTDVTCNGCETTFAVNVNSEEEPVVLDLSIHETPNVTANEHR